MKTTTHPRSPLRIDTEAAVILGEGIVLDSKNELVATFDTVEEAIEFVANANGTDVATVHRESVDRAQMLHQYRANLIAASRNKKQKPA